MKNLLKPAVLLYLILISVGLFAQDRSEEREKRQKKMRELRHDINKALDKTLRELDIVLDEVQVNSRQISRGFSTLGRDFEQAFKGFDKEIEESFRDFGNRNDNYRFECDSADCQDFRSEKNAFDIEKSKKLNKTFQLASNQKLDIENRFGKIHINTWDKSEATVEVTIIARAGSESKAQEILDKISVDFMNDVTGAFCRTQIATMNINGNKNFEINYVVNTPKNNPLMVFNKFGDVYLGNFNGKTDLRVEYGNLKTEHLNHIENNIRIAYGGANIPFAKNCKANVSYADGGFRVGTTENMDLTCSYSDVEIENASMILVKSKYSELEIGTVGTVQGTAGYTDFKIRKLASSLDMDSKYCGDFEIKNISKTFKSINVDNSFSTIELGFSPEAGFSFEVGLGFCELDIDKSNTQFSHINKQNNSANYKGKYGKSAANSTVLINSKYGDVRVSMNLRE